MNHGDYILQQQQLREQERINELAATQGAACADACIDCTGNLCPNTCCKPREESTWCGKLIILPMICVATLFASIGLISGVKSEIFAAQTTNQTEIHQYKQNAESGFIGLGIFGVPALALGFVARHTLAKLCNRLCCDPSTQIESNSKHSAINNAYCPTQTV